MKAFFVTGTGTDVGKTFVTAALCYQLRQRGYKVNAIKPVISGFKEENNDAVEILKALGLPATSDNVDAISPWRFGAALSPPDAAALEGKHYDFQEIADFCAASKGKDFFLIEGAGGLMTPLTQNKTNLDLIKTLHLPVILVAGTYLGAISHTLTCLEALKFHQVPVHLLVISESADAALPLERHIKGLGRFTAVEIAAIPRLESWKEAPDIVSRLTRDIPAGDMVG